MRTFLILAFATLGVAAGDGPTVVAKVQAGARPCVSVPARGSLWVAGFGTSTVLRVDPKTNRVTGRVHVDASPCGLAVGAGALWVDGYGTSTIEKVDTKRLKVVRRIAVGVQPYDVAFLAGSVWSSDNGSGQVSRIDARTAKVVKRLPLSGASGFAVSRGALWVGSTFGTKIFRIDPATLAVVATVDAGVQPTEGSVGPDGSLWVPLRGENTVVRIDPQSNAVAERIKVGTGPFVANFAFGDLWVSSFGGADVWRLRP